MRKVAIGLGLISVLFTSYFFITTFLWANPGPETWSQGPPFTRTSGAYSDTLPSLSGNEVILSNWSSSEAVDNNTYTGSHNDMAIDDNDNIHISYSKYPGTPDYALRYATKIGAGPWNTSELVTTTGASIGYHNSIAVDDNIPPNVHISYLDLFNIPERVRHVTFTDPALPTFNTVTFTFIGFSISGNGETSIALDSAGNPHMSYRASSSAGEYKLCYATDPGGGWVTSQPVPSGGMFAPFDTQYTAIAVDPLDEVHIVYEFIDPEIPGPELNKVWYTDSGWVPTVVPPGAPGYDYKSYKYLSMALDSNNRVHTCYSVVGGNTMQYATNASGAWVITDLEGGPGSATWKSIAVDDAIPPNVHISYGWQYPDFTTELRYMTFTDPATPISRTLVSSIGYGDTSIALDSANSPHISYFNGQYLCHMYKLPGYAGSGTYISPVIGSGLEYSSWGILNYTVTTPSANTEIYIDVLRTNGTVIVSDVPSGTHLSKTYPAEFSGVNQIKLKARFETSNPAETPTLTGWSVDYCDGGPIVRTGTWTVLCPDDKVKVGDYVPMASFEIWTIDGETAWEGLKIKQTGRMPPKHLTCYLYLDDGDGQWGPTDVRLAKRDFRDDSNEINMKITKQGFRIKPDKQRIFIVWHIHADAPGIRKAIQITIDAGRDAFEFSGTTLIDPYSPEYWVP